MEICCYLKDRHSRGGRDAMLTDPNPQRRETRTGASVIWHQADFRRIPMPCRKGEDSRRANLRHVGKRSPTARRGRAAAASCSTKQARNLSKLTDRASTGGLPRSTTLILMVARYEPASEHKCDSNDNHNAGGQEQNLGDIITPNELHGHAPMPDPSLAV